MPRAPPPCPRKTTHRRHTQEYTCYYVCVCTWYLLLRMCMYLVSCICDESICLSRSLWQYRAFFVARMTNRRGHWLGVLDYVVLTWCRWVEKTQQLLRSSSFKSVEHVVEVTAQKRLFLVKSVTPMFTLKMVQSGRQPVTGLSVSRILRKNPN